jgi:hypothetical protein
MLFKYMLLSDEEWNLLAETYAILQVTNVLAMSSQQDSIDSNCFSYYNVANAHNCIESIDNLKVINITEHWTPETEIDMIPTVTKGLIERSDDTILLVERFRSESKRYFKNPDQILMMAFHPIIVSSGFK